MSLLDTINGRTEPRKKYEWCICEYVDIGVGMQRVTEEFECPEHGAGPEVVLLAITDSGSYILNLEDETVCFSLSTELTVEDVYSDEFKDAQEPLKFDLLAISNLKKNETLELKIRSNGTVSNLYTQAEVLDILPIYESEKPRGN